jgi:hypothetical protein
MCYQVFDGTKWVCSGRPRSKKKKKKPKVVHVPIHSKYKFVVKGKGEKITTRTKETTFFDVPALLSPILSDTYSEIEHLSDGKEKTEDNTDNESDTGDKFMGKFYKPLTFLNSGNYFPLLSHHPVETPEISTKHGQYQTAMMVKLSFLLLLPISWKSLSISH